MADAEDFGDCGRPGKTVGDSGRCKQLQKMQKVQKARKARVGRGASMSMIEGDNPGGASSYSLEEGEQGGPRQKMNNDSGP